MKLEVKDKILQKNIGWGSESKSIITIERVTKTLAISGGYRFRRNATALGVQITGCSEWNRTIYSKATDEDIKDVDKQNKRISLEREFNCLFILENVSNEELTKIIKIIKP
jgi:hypothetical protein